LDFGVRLRKTRVDLGLTQKEFIGKLNKEYGTNISESMISKWENGKETPQMEFVRNIVQAYEVSLDYLLGLTDNKDPIYLKNFPKRFKDPEQARMFLNLTTVFTQDGYKTDSLNDEDAVSFANEIINAVRTIAQKYLR